MHDILRVYHDSNMLFYVYRRDCKDIEILNIDRNLITCIFSKQSLHSGSSTIDNVIIALLAGPTCGSSSMESSSLDTMGL